MKGQGFSAAVGCAVWVLLPLVALGAWRFVRGQGWSYSRFGWSIAADEGRESMARDYLATRDLPGMTLEQLRADLGEESSFEECWTYHVGDHEPVLGPEQAVPAFYLRPTLVLRFTRQGVLRTPGSMSGLAGVSARRFDPVTWKSTSPTGRASMALDLLESDRLRGARKEDVRQLLGVPDGGGIEVEYRVGEGVSDGVSLEVKLDLGGRIIDAQVTG